MEEEEGKYLPSLLFLSFFLSFFAALPRDFLCPPLAHPKIALCTALRSRERRPKMSQIPRKKAGSTCNVDDRLAHTHTYRTVQTPRGRKISLSVPCTGLTTVVHSPPWHKGGSVSLGGREGEHRPRRRPCCLSPKHIGGVTSPPPPLGCRRRPHGIKGGPTPVSLSIQA